MVDFKCCGVSFLPTFLFSEKLELFLILFQSTNFLRMTPSSPKNLLAKPNTVKRDKWANAASYNEVRLIF